MNKKNNNGKNIDIYSIYSEQKIAYLALLWNLLRDRPVKSRLGYALANRAKRDITEFSENVDLWFCS